MTNKNLLFAAALLVLVPACNKNVPVTSGVTPTLPHPLSFGTYVSQTKATDLTSENIHDFGVFAYHTANEAWNDAALPNYMYNQKVEGSQQEGFTYSPVKYWPGAEGNKLSFFAYAPYATTTNGITMITSNNTAGTPKIKYAIPDSENNQIDLLAAGSLYDATLQNTGGKIGFTFFHVLSRIGFQARLAAGVDPATSIHINSLSLSSRYPTSGVLDLGDGNWSDIATGREKTYERNFGEGEAGLAVTTERVQISDGNNHLMLIPNENEVFNLVVNYCVVTPDSSLQGGKLIYSHTFTKTLTFTTEKGTAYDFLLTLSPSAIEFDAPIVLDWNVSQDPNGEILLQ